VVTGRCLAASCVYIMGTGLKPPRRLQRSSYFQDSLSQCPICVKIIRMTEYTAAVLSGFLLDRRAQLDFESTSEAGPPLLVSFHQSAARKAQNFQALNPKSLGRLWAQVFFLANSPEMPTSLRCSRYQAYALADHHPKALCYPVGCTVVNGPELTVSTLALLVEIDLANARRTARASVRMNNGGMPP